MADWLTKNANAWWQFLKNAFWNSTRYNWDDQFCSWNGISADDWEDPDPIVFQDADPKNAFTKSPIDWQTPN